MVVHNGFEVDVLSQKNALELISRAQISDSIHNALAPFGIGKNGWRCTAYDESGRLQEFDSSNLVDVVSRPPIGDDASDDQSVDGQRPFDVVDFPTDDESPTPRTCQPNTRQMGRQRGRSMLPCDAARAAPYPLPAPTTEAQSDVDDDPVPKKKQAHSFMIKESTKVSAFIISRLKRMQQLADKKIAKAWIKGICPKKQAKFPYSNKGKDNAEPRQKPILPGWWPDTDTVCRFIEPDHIRRDERMKLLLHLLRLRPTPEQLRIWNQEKSEIHPTHARAGWTAFLKELAGVEIFEDLPKEDKKKTAQRQKLMLQMYEVAEYEEMYQNDGLDADFLYQWEEDDEERKPLPVKRTRQDSVSPDYARDSRASSISVSCSRPKRAKRGSLSDTCAVAPFKLDVDMLNDTAIGNQSHGHAPEANATDLSQGYGNRAAVNPQSRHNNAHIGLYETAPMKRHSSASSHITAGQPAEWQTSSAGWVGHGCTSSFGSASGHLIPQPNEAQISCPGKSGFEPPQFQHQDVVQVHQVAHIPEPQFQTVASTPVFPRADMATIHSGNYMPPPPQAPAYSTPMPSSQYFMPAGPDPAVADFHPPLAQPYHPHNQYGLAERHMTPMQYHHGLPQHNEWGQQLYHHHHRS